MFPKSILTGLAIVVVLSINANADQGSLSNTGGSTLVSSGLSITSTVANPEGSLIIDCPIVSSTACSGGSITFSSTNVSLSGTLTSGSLVESCSGGGRGGHVTCGYTFNANFSGSLTTNGNIQAIVGVTSQTFGTGTLPATGVTAYNSAYSPFYFSDGEHIYRSDDFQGTNLKSFGNFGAGADEFYFAASIAVDSSNRIYVVDEYNCRIARFDDMNGTNWTTFGTCGSGPGQLSNPVAVAVDTQGKIYIADSGNTRIVSIDDMNGTNWATFGTPGSGVNQFASVPSLAVDSSNQIYVADQNNNRIVRMKNMSGEDWTTLTQSQPVGPYIYSFALPAAIAVDSNGKIYVAESGNIISVDDMNGANWTSMASASTTGLNTLSVDASGTLFASGNGLFVADSLAATPLSHSFGYLIYGVAAAHVPSPRPSALTFSPSALSFGSQNAKTTSAAQSVTVTNFGGSKLTFSGLNATAGFTATSNCPDSYSLAASSSCTMSVTFSPTAAGPVSGTLTITDDSGNLGTTQTVTLTGTGTVPLAAVSPASLTFSAQAVNTISATQNVLLTNTGTGPLQIASIATAAPFAQSNGCTTIAPGASCTIQVAFSPTAAGTISGLLTITDGAGMQTVVLTGTGSVAVPSVSVSSTSISFPLQPLNTTSGAQSVKISNTGTTSVAYSGFTVSGDFAATGTCPASIAVGQSCTVAVTFTPIATGARSGTLTIHLSAQTKPIALSGTGTSGGSSPGALTLSPTSVTFANYNVGDNPSKSVTLKNTSTSSVGIANISLAGDHSLTKRTHCGATLAAGASCTVSITFQPVVVGTFLGTLDVVESSGAIDTVAITATAVPST